MKNIKNPLILFLHVLVMAGFTLLQGCATGNGPVDWMNWPYNTPANEPMIVPESDYSDSDLLPPLASAPVETTPANSIVMSEPFVPDPVIPEQPSQTYIVKKGDTLSGIASMYDTTWQNLAEFNGMSDPNTLYVNQEILIPGSLRASEPAYRSSSPSGGSDASSGGSSIRQGSSYVIQKGDTLSGIANRAGLSVQEIQAANALSGHMIVAGKSLSIPKKGEISASNSYSAPKNTNPEPSVEPEPAPAPEPAPLADIAPAETASSAPVYDHVMYPGETLEDVARQYGSTKDAIMKLNGITNPDDVKSGTKLMVPIPE